MKKPDVSKLNVRLTLFPSYRHGSNDFYESINPSVSENMIRCSMRDTHGIHQVWRRAWCLWPSKTWPWHEMNEHMVSLYYRATNLYKERREWRRYQRWDISIARASAQRRFFLPIKWSFYVKRDRRCFITKLATRSASNKLSYSLMRIYLIIDIVCM